MSYTNQSVHVDAVLTNISIAFMQNRANFIAGQVFPNVPVSKQSDRYYTFDRGDFNRDEAQQRAPGAESSGSSFNIDNTPTYFTPVWAWHHDVPWQTMVNADAVLNLTRAATEYVMQKLLIRKEVDWVGKYFAGSIWTNDWDGVSGTPTGSQVKHWSDQVDGDPIKNIRDGRRTIMESTGFEANTLVVGRAVYDALVDHPDIIDRVKYSGGVGNTNPARVNATSLAQLFEVDRVLVSNSIRNTAADNLTNSHSFIAGKKALLCYAAPTPSLMAPSAGYTFSWTGYLDQGNEFGVAIKRIPMDLKESDRVEGGMAFDHKLVSADLGFFWDTIVA
jgi:Phage major capsid protein E